MWCLIVSIPDLCPLSYFDQTHAILLYMYLLHLSHQLLRQSWLRPSNPASFYTHSKMSCKTPVSGYCIIINVINITVSLGLVELKKKSATISVKTKHSLITIYDSHESRYQQIMCDPQEKPCHNLCIENFKFKMGLNI